MTNMDCSNNMDILRFGDYTNLRCDNNCASITVGNESVVYSQSNCGVLILGNSCRISAKNNKGLIRVGNGCTMTIVDKNCGQIWTGQNCTIESANDNCGLITCAKNCTIGSANRNYGRIRRSDGEDPTPTGGISLQPETTVDSEARPQTTISTCSICFERPRNLAFNCGHTCCTTCSEKLHLCHMCRGNITQRLHLFDS